MKAQAAAAAAATRAVSRAGAPLACTTAPATAVQRFLPPQREMPENAVFISYAREDLPAVQKLKTALDAAGITTWFDMDRLESGDDYDLKIRGNIARCSYFLPVCIDGTTEADAVVPEKFKAVHFSRLPGGEPPPEFTRRLQELFNARR